MVEIPYKIPFLEMFQDLDALLRGNSITDLDVLELYKMTSIATREDCISCSNATEIDELSNFSESVHNELKELIGNVEFKSRAIEKTVQTNVLVQKVPSSLKTKVEPASNILGRKGIYET